MLVTFGGLDRGIRISTYKHKDENAKVGQNTEYLFRRKKMVVSHPNSGIKQKFINPYLQSNYPSFFTKNVITQKKYYTCVIQRVMQIITSGFFLKNNQNCRHI